MMKWRVRNIILEDCMIVYNNNNNTIFVYYVHCAHAISVFDT